MNAKQVVSDVARAPDVHIGGRYVHEAQLGTGGMGVVYRVRDASTGRTVALKQLHPHAGRTERALFEREYHTLMLLKHPRIVEVYDYGIHAGAPYYTMELLDGVDLHTLSPLPYREACRHLRDVASSLALLAAHRLVHRDLTARNVRVTSDGHSKLIDFGALAPFGVAKTLVGTPPYVPPEALRGLLDQHADLFALGALAYFLLTRTHAFPGRSMDEIQAAWARRPERPSAVVARLIEQGADLSPVPKALDELVLSLLSLDPQARPQSAAEAIERLTLAGGLEPEPTILAAQSYLLSAALAGREVELGHANELVAGALAGSGSVLFVQHAEGAGATRLLAEISLRARLAGATVLEVDGDVTRAPYAGSRALVENLMLAAPVEARAAALPDADLAGWLRGMKTDRPSSGAGKLDAAVAPLGNRLNLISALERWFSDVSRACPLVILVDDASELDEGTATLLAVLASTQHPHAIAVVIAERDGETPVAPAALERLRRAARVVELSPLTSSDTQAVVQSLFGEVSNVERLAHWAQRISGGNPGRMMELLGHLVARGLARYVDGAWMLPRELPEDDLPSRPEEAAERKFSELDEPARKLACALSIHDGRLSLELCMAVAAAERIEAFAALDALTSSGMLVGSEGGYRFAQRSTREALIGRLAPADQLRVHRVIAEFLLSGEEPDVASQLSAGWHLLAGGDELRGSEVLRRVGLEFMGADQLREAIPVLEAVLATFRKLNRPRDELCGVLHPLAAAGYYAERRLAEQYGDEALELLGEETGLALAGRVRPFVGSYVALLIGLVYALILHLFGRRGGLRALNDNISVMGALTASLVGVSVICLDPRRAERRAAHFQLFESLGLWHAGAFNYSLSRRLVGVAEDRPTQTLGELNALLRRFDTPGGVIGFPAPLVPLTRGGLLYALGALQGFMDAPLALERADELERCGVRFLDMLACQIRANYYAYQGNEELAQEHERRVELHATRTGTTWQAEVWTPSSRIVAYRRTYDLLGIKRSSEELDRLSLEIPSLEKYARAARAILALLRGEYDVAIPLLETLHTEEAPRAFIGWTALAGALAEAYNETGRSERAAELCEQVVAGFTEGDRLVAAFTVDVELQLAIADARCGRPADAERRLAELLALHTPNRGAVTLGRIHRAWAEVARAAGDADLLRYHRASMDHWFRSTKNPALVAECERYRAPSDSPRAPAPDPDSAAPEPATVAELPQFATDEAELTESATVLVAGMSKTDAGSSASS
ncbi:MAG TPA: protein kinase [Polyangiaceae bacterium]|jgi:hypothetical protein|nr:protein kinase [Polyangiaceae bacterium]